MKPNNNVIVYQTKSGALELKGDFERETVWATQAQIAQIFEIDRTVATKHINNVLNSNEVDKESNVQKTHFANADRPVALYSLDVMLAVGYRANSARAIQFRQWATKTLRQHIVQGFSINRTRVKKNYEVFLKAVEEVKALLPSSMEDAANITELIIAFASTWLSLDAYDKSELPIVGATKKDVEITGEELTANIFQPNRIEYFLIYKQDTPVAVSSLTNFEKIGDISNVGSLKFVRGEGFGKKATLCCIDRSMSNGNTSHCLATEIGTFADSFYKKISFESRFKAICLIKDNI